MLTHQTGSNHKRKLEVIVMANRRSSTKPQEIQSLDVPKISAALFKIRVNVATGYNGTPCWEWSGRRNAAGYSLLRIAGEFYAHRVFYRYLIGAIPEGYEVDHLCKNRCCCSPFHLEAVSPTVNRQRRDDSFTHCRRGHEFTPDNTLLKVKDSGAFQRKCRACNRERARKFNQRHPGYSTKYRKQAA